MSLGLLLKSRTMARASDTRDNKKVEASSLTFAVTKIHEVTSRRASLCACAEYGEISSLGTPSEHFGTRSMRDLGRCIRRVDHFFFHFNFFFTCSIVHLFIIHSGAAKPRNGRNCLVV